MSNIIELARFRGKSGAQDREADQKRSSKIVIELRADSTHSFSMTGEYATSSVLAVQALVEVSAELLSEVSPLSFSPS